MSTNISVDLNNVEDTPTKTLLRLVDAKQQMQNRLAAWHATLNSCPGLFKRLEELELEPNLNFSDGCIDLNFAGTPELLTKVWAELRRAGFKNDGFPSADKKSGSFSTYWRADGKAKIWMYFSSSLCRAVQVGTRMVEQPIYETQCGELPQQTDLGELLSAEPQIDPVPLLQRQAE